MILYFSIYFIIIYRESARNQKGHLEEFQWSVIVIAGIKITHAKTAHVYSGTNNAI